VGESCDSDSESSELDDESVAHVEALKTRQKMMMMKKKKKKRKRRRKKAMIKLIVKSLNR
jgi:hypothetical protein